MGRLILFFLFNYVISINSCFAADHDEAYTLVQSGKILPLEKILKITKKHIQGHILEVELEKEEDQLIYELKILDNNGTVWKVKINAKNGIKIDAYTCCRR